MRIEALCERLLASVGLAFFSAPVLAGHPDRPFKLNIRADFRNAFNHPQYAPGQINNVNFRSGLTNTTSYLTPGHVDFGKFDRVFRSNARIIQMGAIVRF